jgi:hypothetical protein
VSYQYYQGDRSGSGSAQTISGLAATTVTTSAAIGGTPRAGDCAEIAGSTNNDGIYTLTTIPGGSPWTYGVRPNVNTGTVDGTLQLRTRTNAKLSSTALVSVTAIAGTNDAVVEVGSGLLAAEIYLGDRLAIFSNTTTPANNGGWCVRSVLNDTHFIATSPDGGTALATDAAPDGNVEIRHGVFVIEVVDEASWTWVTLIAGLVPKPGPSTNDFGPTRYQDILDWLEGQRDKIIMPSVTLVDITTDGLGAQSTFTSQRVSVVCGASANRASGGEAIQGQHTVMQHNGSGPGVLTTIGLQSGNQFSASHGAAWIQVIPPSSSNAAAPVLGVDNDIFASFIDSGAMNVTINKATGSVFHGQATGGFDTIESCVFCGSAGTQGAGRALFSGGSATMENILVSQKTALSTLIAAGAVIGGLLISDTVTGRFTHTQSNLTILDPRTDIDLSSSGSDAFQNDWTKKYTFNPRFVSSTDPDRDTVPIVGARVRIYEVDDGTGAAASPGTQTLVHDGDTDSNGQLNSGSGVVIRRQYVSGGAGTTTTQNRWDTRVVIEAEGYRLVDEILEVTAKRTDDFPLLQIAPDWEGEFNE